jgi:multidrug efflux pump subunit AcrA (membrane-fusion protein)
MKCARRISLLMLSVICVQVVVGGQTGRTIREGGKLEPAESHTIRSQVSRPVAVLHVAPEGKLVEKGDLLVELDASAWLGEAEEFRARLLEAAAQRQTAEEALPMVKKEADAAVELAEQGLHVAKLALEMYVTGEYPAQIAEAEAAVSLAEEHHLLAAERLAWLRAYEDKTAPDQLSQAKLALGEAESRLKTAENRLHLLKDVMHEYRKASLRLAVMEREFALMRAQNEAKRTMREAEIAVEVARARTKAQIHRSELFDKEVNACRLYAPSAGTVQYVREPWGGSSTDVLIERGSVVHNQQPLLKVVDTRRFTLAVPVDLQIAQQVKTGREVSVHVDAFPAQTFKGRVAEMRVVAQTPSGVAQGVLIVTVENTTSHLRSGMSARVEFEL